MLVYIAEGTQAIIDADTYKKSDSIKRKEIDRKEQVILKQIELKKGCFDLRDSLFSQIGIKDDIIATQKNTAKITGSNPKHWSVSVGAGYGYSFGKEVQRGVTIGVFVGRTIFRF